MVHRSNVRSNRLTGLLACIVVLWAAVGNAAEIVLHVSPAGHDRWTGKRPDPQAGSQDGPVATPQRALELARNLRAEMPQAGPVRILLRGGTYFLSAPLVLTPADSGTAERPLIWSAYQDERPVLSGGRRLTNWKPVRVNDRDAWVAKLPGGPNVRELWLDGQRLSRARWPKKGTFAVAGLSDSAPRGQWSQGVTEFRFAGDDLKTCPEARDGELIVATKWVESHLPIASVDLGKHLVRFTKKSVFLIEPGDRYWVENVNEHLTEPGEFQVDAKAGTVTVIPPPGVDPNKAETVVPHLAQVLRLVGRPEAGEFVSHLVFRGIGVAHTEWYFDHAFIGQQEAAGQADQEWALKPDPSRSGFSQAAIGVPGAIWGRGVRSCRFEHCTVAHVGTYGIELGEGCQRNTISRCTLTDLGAGGIKLGEVAVRDDDNRQSSGNVVEDCTISDGGNLFPSCVAVWIGQSPGNKIAHNEIRGFWYTALSLGWTWGYAKAAAQRNLVEFNHVHHIGIKSDGGQPILSDMAGIYTLGNHEGTVIRHNLFHDIAAIRYGGWGIYFDEGTTHILAENNLVYRTTHGGFHQHYGKENTFRNNIIAFARDAQIQRSRVEDHLSFRFERNVVYWERGPLLAGDWGKLNVAFDGNTYWRTEPGEIKFGNLTWAEWQKTGMDRESKIADPHFADPSKGDFRLSAGSAEAFAGFVPFELSTVGPR